MTVPGQVVEGRISLLRCPTALLIGGQPVEISELLAIDARRSYADPLGNGIALGAATGAGLGAIVGTLASGGDISIFRAGLPGLLLGAFAGFVLDVVREKPPDWIRVWQRNP